MRCNKLRLILIIVSFLFLFASCYMSTYDDSKKTVENPVGTIICKRSYDVIITLECPTSGATIYYEKESYYGGWDGNYSKYSPTSYYWKGEYYYGLAVDYGKRIRVYAEKPLYEKSAVVTMTVKERSETPSILTAYYYYYDSSKCIVPITAASDSVIKYTLDETDPELYGITYAPSLYRSTSGEYITGILVSRGTEIKAISIETDKYASFIATKYIY